MKLYIITTYFREFRSNYYLRRKAVFPVRELIRERWDWTNDVLSYAGESSTQASAAIANDPISQSVWAMEHASLFSARDLEVLRPRLDPENWSNDAVLWWQEQERPLAESIALAQVKETRPDVVLIMNAFFPSLDFRKRVRESGPLVAVQCTQPLTDLSPLGSCDLVLTVSPAREQVYAEAALPVQRFDYGFNPGILPLVADIPRERSVVFIGQLSEKHHQRRALLCAIAKAVPVRWYGPERDLRFAEPPLRNAYHGEAFGVDMYRALAGSSVGWNHPPDFEPALFGMFRTFEVMGMGLPMIMAECAGGYQGFKPGEHLLTYQSAAEAITLCDRLLADPREMKEIGARGQARVLEHYSAQKTVARFLSLLEASLSQTRELRSTDRVGEESR